VGEEGKREEKRKERSSVYYHRIRGNWTVLVNNFLPCGKGTKTPAEDELPIPSGDNPLNPARYSSSCPPLLLVMSTIVCLF